MTPLARRLLGERVYVDCPVSRLDGRSVVVVGEEGDDLVVLPDSEPGYPEQAVFVAPHQIREAA